MSTLPQMPVVPPTGREGLFGGVQRVVAVSLVEADPELAEAVGKDDMPRAAEAARARVLHLDQGHWRPPRPGDARGVLGLLVVDGLICRSVSVGAE